MNDPMEYADIRSILSAIASLQSGQTQILELLSNQSANIQEWFTPAEFAKAIGRSPYTVRCWLKDGRIIGQKRTVGRGNRLEWEIPRAELLRFRNHGRAVQQMEGRNDHEQREPNLDR